ncbi:MAG: bifunctional DNA primase/polymerase [Candidatus Nezhaarchaeales archaeon]
MERALKDFLDFYLEQGLSVIPAAPLSKRPLLKWKQYAERRPSDSEVYLWFSTPGLNVAVVTGEVSGGLIIVDFEREEDYRAFFKGEVEKHTFTVKTPHGGVHVWLREAKPSLTPGRVIRLSEAHPVDVLGGDGYALAPPSTITHALCKGCGLKGLGFYEPVGAMEIMTVEDAYGSLLRRVEELGWGTRKVRRFEVKEVLGGVEEGRRNVSAFRYARYLMFTVGLDAETVWHELKRWNANNRPPLEEEELKRVWRSAQNYLFTDLKRRRARI